MTRSRQMSRSTIRRMRLGRGRLARNGRRSMPPSCTRRTGPWYDNRTRAAVSSIQYGRPLGVFLAMYSTIITHFGGRPYHPILTKSVVSLPFIVPQWRSGSRGSVLSAFPQMIIQQAYARSTVGSKCTLWETQPCSHLLPFIYHRPNTVQTSTDVTHAILPKKQPER